MRLHGCILQLLDEIAAKFYNIQRQNPLEGLFSEMFKASLILSCNNSAACRHQLVLANFLVGVWHQLGISKSI